MATIIEKKNRDGAIASYKLVCCVGRDEGGKQVWRTKTIKRPDGLTPAKEKKEVQRRADEWETEQKDDFEKRGNVEDKSKITLADFVKYHWWPDHVNDGEHTPSSVSFSKYMSGDIVDRLGKLKLCQIDAETVKRYIKYLRTEATTKGGEPYSVATIQHHFGTLRNILEYARRLHYIQSDACQDLSQREKPHRDNKKIDFLTPDEAQRFMKCLNDEPLYWRCFMNVLITTGLRRGEAVGLQWGDIDGSGLTMNVSRNVTMDKDAPEKYHVGATKTKEGRTVAISARLYALLMELKAEQASLYGLVMSNAYIFNRDNSPYAPMHPTTPTKWQAKFVKRHNLPKVSPHDLRHTAATLALESGADLKQVQELLGHADPSTTMQFYAGVTETAKRRTVEGIEALIS